MGAIIAGPADLLRTIGKEIQFVFDMRLSLYEHQSTKNPNLPLRFLNYIADLYSAMTEGENLYGEKMIPIPTPEFYIFYNGRYRAEVIKVCLYEYDQEKHMAFERRENFEKGVEQGIEQGINKE